MSIFYTILVLTRQGGMKPAEAAPLVRQWFEEHGRAVEMTLARSGVPSSTDRADLRQEVFTTAFLALSSGEKIVKPRAWLKACARNKACNYREKESKRAPPAGEQEAVSPMASPAQIAEDRAELYLAFECLDDEMEEIVLARAEGLGWDETARGNGITVARAKYLHALAITLMEAALKREDARTGKRRAVPFPIWLAQVVDALRAEVDNVSPELDRRIRENLDRFMEAAGAGAPEPERRRVSVAGPSPISIPITPPPTPTRVGPVLGSLGGGVAIGIFVACLLHAATPDKPSPEPIRARATPALAMVESAAPVGESEAAITPLLPANGSRGIPLRRLAQSNQAGQGASSAIRLKETSTPASLALLDLARVALQDENAGAALALLAQHAHRFPGKPNEDERRALMQRVCAAPAVRGAAECVDASAVRSP